MLLDALNSAIRLKLPSWVIFIGTLAAGSVMAQEPIRLAAQPVTITPPFKPEGLPNRFEEGASLSMGMVANGDTWVACLAYSPDGSMLAVGDCPTRPLCVLGGTAPVNQNGGLIRLIHVPTRQVTRTLSPVKRPGCEYEIMSLAYTPDGRTLVALGKEGWPKDGKGREYGYHVTAWDSTTGRQLLRINSAKVDDWTLPTFSQNASTFAAMTQGGLRVWDVSTGQPRPVPTEAPLKPTVLRNREKII